MPALGLPQPPLCRSERSSVPDGVERSDDSVSFNRPKPKRIPPADQEHQPAVRHGK